MQFENLPDDIILEFLSHMNSRQIVNTCKANRNVNRLCKSNRNLITKYSLKNDYGFTIFPQNYDYISIRSYMVETFGMSAYKFNNRNRMLMDVVKDNRIDVLRFLVANGANIFEDAVTTAVKYKKIDALKYFIEELHFDITNVEDDILYFEDLCVEAFLDEDVKNNPIIIDYLVKNYRQFLTHDLLERIHNFLIIGFFDDVDVADYVTYLMNSNDFISLTEFLRYH